MCGAQHLMIEDIVNILIPYPNYGFWQRAADPSNPSDLPRAPASHSRSAPCPLKTRLQVLSMCFRNAAVTPSILRASMTWKSTTWSVCTVRKCSNSRVSVSPHARLIANASASHRARMKNGVSVSCVVMNQRESIKQHHRGLDGLFLSGTGRTLQLRSAVPFMSLRRDANDIPA